MKSGVQVNQAKKEQDIYFFCVLMLILKLRMNSEQMVIFLSSALRAEICTREYAWPSGVAVIFFSNYVYSEDTEKRSDIGR